MPSSAADVLRLLRANQLEDMWEDNKKPSIVGTLNAGIGAAKRNYPPNTYVGPSGKPGICDTVVGKKWIEVKAAWTYKDLVGQERNGNLVKHLFTESESAVKDVRIKLSSLLNHHDVEFVGFLLVCFWSTTHLFEQRLIQRLIDEGGLALDWVEYKTDPWQPENTDLWIQLHYWERASSPQT